MPTLESERIETGVNFSWLNVVNHLIDVLGASACSPEEMFERYAYLLETYYPDFRFTVMATNPENEQHRYRLIMMRGFPIGMAEFEQMVYENDAFMRPYEISMRPRFLNDYAKTNSREGNCFDEGSAAHIPICTQGKLLGWLTMSSPDNDYEWSEKEMRWLPVTGRICGAFVNLQIENIRGTASSQFVRDELRPYVSQKSVENAASPELDAAIARSLTRREKEVIACLSKGDTNSQISEELCISESTVRKHIENIFSKLGVNNRTQAALLGQQFIA